MPKNTRLKPGPTLFAVRCKNLGIWLRSTGGDEINHSSNAKNADVRCIDKYVRRYWYQSLWYKTMKVGKDIQFFSEKIQ